MSNFKKYMSIIQEGIETLDKEDISVMSAGMELVVYYKGIQVGNYTDFGEKTTTTMRSNKYSYDIEKPKNEKHFEIIKNKVKDFNKIVSEKIFEMKEEIDTIVHPNKETTERPK
jgi:hypothetical protein